MWREGGVWGVQDEVLARRDPFVMLLARVNRCSARDTPPL